MKINLDTHTDDIQIQILPLIDVIFCILTFFILGAVGLSRQQAIGLDLPRASTAEAQMREMFMVVIDPIGQVSIENKPQQWVSVNPQQLTGILQRYREVRPDGLIVLHAHPIAQYEKVVQVLDLLRAVGGDRVALATLPTREPELNQSNPGNRINPSPSFPAPPNTIPPALPGREGSTTPNLTPGGTTPNTTSESELDTGDEIAPEGELDTGDAIAPEGEIDAGDAIAPEGEIDTGDAIAPETPTPEAATTGEPSGDGGTPEN